MKRNAGSRKTKACRSFKTKLEKRFAGVRETQVEAGGKRVSIMRRESRTGEHRLRERRKPFLGKGTARREAKRRRKETKNKGGKGGR